LTLSRDILLIAVDLLILFPGLVLTPLQLIANQGTRAQTKSPSNGCA
jgi:hypothetical protein